MCIIRRKTHYKNVYLRLDNLGDLVITNDFLPLNTLQNRDLLIVSKKVKPLIDYYNVICTVRYVDQQSFRQSLVYRIRTLFALSTIHANNIYILSRSDPYRLSYSIARLINREFFLSLYKIKKQQQLSLKINPNERHYLFKKIGSGKFSRNEVIRNKVNGKVLINISSSDVRRDLTTLQVSQVVKKYGDENCIITYFNTTDVQIKQFSSLVIEHKTLEDLFALVERANKVYTPETFLSHYCNSLGVRCYSVVGGGHFGRFMPIPRNYNNHSNVIFEKMNCFNCNWSCSKDYINNRYPCVSNVRIVDP